MAFCTSQGAHRTVQHWTSSDLLWPVKTRMKCSRYNHMYLNFTTLKIIHVQSFYEQTVSEMCFYLVCLFCIVFFCLYHLSFVSLKYMYIHVHKTSAWSVRHVVCVPYLLSCMALHSPLCLPAVKLFPAVNAIQTSNCKAINQ